MQWYDETIMHRTTVSLAMVRWRYVVQIGIYVSPLIGRTFYTSQTLNKTRQAPKDVLSSADQMSFPLSIESLSVQQGRQGVELHADFRLILKKMCTVSCDIST